MQEAKNFKMFKGNRDEKAVFADWLKLFFELPKVREICAKADLVENEAEFEALLDAEFENYQPADSFETLLYMCPGREVCLLPGSVNFHLGRKGFFAIAREWVQLDDYEGMVFVFRNKTRSMLAEVRVGHNCRLSLVEHTDEDRVFIDPEWLDDASEPKVILMGEYKRMLDRMRCSEKAS